MTIYYVDFESGNDANSGTSFAQRLKTIAGATTAKGVLPGDTIRVKKTPDPTLVGNATWVGTGQEPTISITSTTNASPIVVTTSTSHGYSNGDWIYLASHSTNTNANGLWEIAGVTSTTFQLVDSTGNGTGGATGNVRKVNSNIVTLDSAVNANIHGHYNVGSSISSPIWTASTNVTTSTTTSGRMMSHSSSIAIGASFITGKAAYKQLPSTLNLSGYQQVSFWISQQTGTAATGAQLELRLCTDTDGNTAAHSIPINIRYVQTNAFHVITHDFGSNLNSSIQSIALYVLSDVGAQTFYLSNIIACKASSSDDALTLHSMINKNGEESYGIRGIIGDKIFLGGGYTTASNMSGYYGVSENVSTYKRECYQYAGVTTSNGVFDSPNVTSSPTNPILISGGWDTTDMSTQDGETWVHGGNGNGSCMIYSSENSFIVENINSNYFYYAHNIFDSVYSILIRDCKITNCAASITISPISNGAYDIKFDNISLYNNSNVCYLYYVTDVSFKNSQFRNYFDEGIFFYNVGKINLKDCDFINMNGYSIIELDTSVGHIQCDNCDFSLYNDTPDGYGVLNTFDSSIYPKIIFNNCLFGVRPILYGNTFLNRLPIYSHQHDQIIDNHKIYFLGGEISSESTVRHSPSGISWAFEPTTVISAANALELSVAKILVQQDVETSVKLWMRRSNTGLSMRLMCKQQHGIAVDVYTDMTEIADTWEQVTLTFTPTITGVIEIVAQAWGGTTYIGYVDDLTVT